VHLPKTIPRNLMGDASIHGQRKTETVMYSSPV
jgi:hypothetical protein